MKDVARGWTIQQLGETVARTDRYAGGGAVAAMSLVGAAATAELVFQLSSRRKSTTEQDRERIQRAITLCSELRNRFVKGIDEDIASLERLMSAQSIARRARKENGDVSEPDANDQLQRAINQAIETPVAIATDALHLLETIAELQNLARPFTASDLGAAAATVNGAITSLLLMAEVNLGMVESPEKRSTYESAIESIRSATRTKASSVIEQTRIVISGNG